MSKSNKSKSNRTKRKIQRKIDDFSKGIGLSPSRILFAALLVGGLALLIYWVGSGDTKEADAPRTQSESERQKLELSTDQELERIFNTPPADSRNFMFAMNQMNEFEKELSKIESSRELTEAQKQKLERIRLRNQSVIVTLMIRNKITCEAEKKALFDRCQQHLDSPNELLSEASHFWLCTVPAVEFCERPSQQTFNSFATAIRDYKKGFIITPRHSENLAALVKALASRSEQTLGYAKKAYLALAEQMATSDVQDIRFIAERLNELALFGEFNLTTLDYRIAWSDPTAAEDFRGAVEVLSEHPDSDVSVWATIIRSYESFLAIDQIEKVGRTWQEMWELSGKISDPENMKVVRDVLSRQKERAMSIGRPFDITGAKLPTGEAIGLDGQDYNVIIFCDKGRESIGSLVKLGSANKEGQVSYRPILALEEKDIDSLKSVPKNIAVATYATSTKYLEAFPADFFPYILLIDKSGNIVAANLQIDQVANRVAKLEAAKQRANADRN